VGGIAWLWQIIAANLKNIMALLALLLVGPIGQLANAAGA
jgi:hypothetical protein